MKKMEYQNTICEVEVVSDAVIRKGVPCGYENDTIAYAVERFFTQCKRFRRECTKECWEIRVAKGKNRHARSFSYLIPSVLMELPGGWVRLAGSINAAGVHIKKIELLSTHPCFAGSGLSA